MKIPKMSIPKMRIPTPNFYLMKQGRILNRERKHLLGEIEKTKKFPEYERSDEGKIQTMEEYQENVELRKRLEAQLKEIAAATKKIDDNKYGICENCKGKIEEGRLEIVPTARLCVTCAGKK